MPRQGRKRKLTTPMDNNNMKKGKGSNPEKVATKQSILSSDGKVFHPCQYCSRIFPLKTSRNAHMSSCPNKEYILTIGKGDNNNSPTKSIETVKNSKKTPPKTVTPKSSSSRKRKPKKGEKENTTPPKKAIETVNEIAEIKTEDETSTINEPKKRGKQNSTTQITNKEPNLTEAEAIEKDSSDTNIKIEENTTNYLNNQEDTKSVIISEGFLLNQEQHVSTNKKIIINNSITVKPISPEKHELNVEDGNNVKNQDATYKCRHCNSSFENPLDKLKHTRDYHKPIRIIVPYDEVAQHFDNEDKNYCPICDKTIKARNYKSVFVKHLLTHTQGTIYTCSICAKRFRRKDHRRNHEIRHEVQC